MLIDNHQKPAELDRDLDLPLRWELTPHEMALMQRRIDGERNRAASERMMGMMRGGRRG